MKYRVLIVDDEPVSRRRLKRFVEGIPDLEVLGETGDGRSAVEWVQQHRPDLMFLDIQMPELDGFETLRQITPAFLPVVIFVTAFEEFALRAFESQALDYVLKPISELRIKQAVDRARIYLQGTHESNFQKRVSTLLKETVFSPEANRRNEPLLIKSDGKVFFLKPSEIRWIEAVGDYMKIHVGGESHLARATMREMEERLGRAGFARIHRSRLVNLDHVKELRPVSNGESMVVLKTGERLPGSRGLLRLLENGLTH
jgi:two-component system, LytTR family, response regulator